MKFIYLLNLDPEGGQTQTVTKVVAVNTESGDKTEKIIVHQNPGNSKDKNSKEKNDEEKPSANNESEKSEEDNSNIQKIEISKKEQSEVINLFNSTKIEINGTEPATVEVKSINPVKNLDTKSQPLHDEFNPKIKSTEEGKTPGKVLKSVKTLKKLLMHFIQNFKERIKNSK